MPREISLDDVDTKLLERTFVVYRKGSGDNLKYKLRTKSILYTLKLNATEANNLNSQISTSGFPIEIIDV